MRRAREPLRARAPGDRDRRRRDASLKRRAERGRDLPRPLHAGGGRRLPRRPEPRAADRRHRALLLAARRRRLPEAHELRALRAAEAARARLGRDPARRARGAAPATARSVELRLAEDPARAPRARGRARGGGGSSCERARASRAARARAQDRARPRSASSSTLDGSGELPGRDRHPVLRPHARVVREARPVRPAARARRATSRSTCTTRSRTSASRSARPCARRSATRAGIRRYGSQVLPMAEAKVEVAVDVSNRALPRLPGGARERPRSATSTCRSPRTSSTRSRRTPGSICTSSSATGKSPHHVGRGDLQGPRARAARRRSSATRADAACRR